jgi:hypothetical protein
MIQQNEVVELPSSLGSGARCDLTSYRRAEFKRVTKSCRLFKENGPLYILFSLYGISHTQLRYWCVLDISGPIR